MLKIGRYAVLEVLGSGRFAITYKAKNSKGDVVVLKTLNPERLGGPDFERLNQVFAQEASKLAQCHHPNIVRVFTPFSENGIWYIPMEYIAGKTLAEREGIRQVMSEKEALTYILQVADALDVIHKNGLVHRDIKPANIMLRIQEGLSSAVLIDFGLARELDHTITKTREEEREDGYSPPELYAHPPKASVKTDVYGLGATLYNLISGKTPPTALERRVRRLYELKVPGATKKIENAINLAMKYDAYNRPTSVKEWLIGSGIRKKKKKLRFWAINWATFWAAVSAIAAVAAVLLVLF